MTSIRDFLRVFRSQTASATLLLVMTCFLVGNGQLFSWQGLMVAIFAVLIHWFSFGHNSLMDTAMGYDKADKNKQHHPLVSGAIKIDTAHNVVHTGIVCLAIAGFLIANWCGGNLAFAMFWFAIFIVAGFAYNNGQSKSTILGFIPITMSFTALSVFAYYIVAQQMSNLMAWVAIYIAFVIFFQIAYSGHLKEIAESEKVGANLLRAMGARVKDGMYVPGVPTQVFACTLKLANFAVGAFILVALVPYNPLVFIVWGLFLVAGATLLVHLVRKRAWDRNKSLTHMSLMEVVSIYMLPIILTPVIGWLPVVVLLVVGLVYFVGMNRFLWGTLLRPRV